ncbi:hypothetical protein LZ30DRAFT_278143 [Colletotrichum cereale]|nr:hypothetical protein LZ30DRAFT_278143 [Colletotrichum cereale]
MAAKNCCETLLVSVRLLCGKTLRADSRDNLIGTSPVAEEKHKLRFWFPALPESRKKGPLEDNVSGGFRTPAQPLIFPLEGRGLVVGVGPRKKTASGALVLEKHSAGGLGAGSRRLCVDKRAHGPSNLRSLTGLPTPAVVCKLGMTGSALRSGVTMREKVDRLDQLVSRRGITACWPKLVPQIAFTMVT